MASLIYQKHIIITFSLEVADHQSRAKAPFMGSYDHQFVSAFDDFKVLTLPYKMVSNQSQSFSMYLLLPDALDGFPPMVERVCSKPGLLDRYRPKSCVGVEHFRIPKFKFSFGFEV